MGKMPRFEALSFGDKWRVSRFLYRGEAPSDPRMAAAAVELAEYHLSRGRLIRLMPVITLVFFGAVAIFFAAVGDTAPAVLNALVALTGVGQFVINPATRPANVARSLEASRRVAGSAEQDPDQGGGEEELTDAEGNP